MLPRCRVAIDDDLADRHGVRAGGDEHDTMANVAATERLAIVTTHPISHCATQLKGIVQRTRPARDDEEPFIAEHFAGFGGVLNTIGYPLRVTRSMTHWPAFALEMRVDEIYEQSPGPNAGTRLR